MAVFNGIKNQLEDGKIIASISEERLSRIKNEVD